ncbi:MAG: hypothetical protein MAG453_01142 [Calditrichaeota bacterium]|nr:hypothetical protein [Calditrichota bacterium]
MEQTFRDTRFRNDGGRSVHENGDPYAFGRLEQMSGWERLLNILGRLFGRSLTKVETLAQRVVIQVEITHLRLRLRTLYNRLGKLIFWLVVAEERGDALADSRTKSFLDRLQETHSELASQRQRLEKMRLDRRRDEFAGA